MDLKEAVREFLSSERARFSRDLMEKYGLEPDEGGEISSLVEQFLMQRYGPAITFADQIGDCVSPSVLFIWKEDCQICKRIWPILEESLRDRPYVRLWKINYADPAGLLYHILHSGDGLLPLIAIIKNGQVVLLKTGEVVPQKVYEVCCSQTG